MQVSPDEARAILELLADVKLSQLNTEQKREIFKDLISVATAGPSKRVTLTNVDANKPVEAIKVIRVITGCGLREAKDLYDSYTHRWGRRELGEIGPLDIPITADEAITALKRNMDERNWVTSIHIVPA